MATDYTVILTSRQHFGDDPGSVGDFVGVAKSISFNCPSVDPNETAFLLFQSLDVSIDKNVFRVNGVDVFGGLPAIPGSDTWVGNVMLLEPRHNLKAVGNVLHVESRDENGEVNGNLDDFVLDNVVIVFKTHTGVNRPQEGEAVRGAKHF